jgi:hypothetical protein
MLVIIVPKKYSPHLPETLHLAYSYGYEFKIIFHIVRPQVSFSCHMRDCLRNKINMIKNLLLKGIDLLYQFLDFLSVS